jgi:hypothetical protein
MIYYFELERESESLFIPVLGNPFVNRLVSSLPIRLVAVGEREQRKTTG